MSSQRRFTASRSNCPAACEVLWIPIVLHRMNILRPDSASQGADSCALDALTGVHEANPPERGGGWIMPHRDSRGIHDGNRSTSGRIPGGIITFALSMSSPMTTRPAIPRHMPSAGTPSRDGTVVRASHPSHPGPLQNPMTTAIYLGGRRFLAYCPEYLLSSTACQNATPRMAAATPMMRKTPHRGASQGILENISPTPVLSRHPATVPQPRADERMTKKTSRVQSIVNMMISQKTTLHSGSRLRGTPGDQGELILSGRIGRWR